MERSTSLVFLCLSLFLVLTPLALVKPGWPAGLKADEPAYYLMAMSLAWDRDLRLEDEDIRRLFNEFPYNATQNVILATDDGWHTVYYGKPYIYSLFAAPAARFFGASGLLAFNVALTLGMIWLGARYLRRFNPASVALLFATGFFLLSAGYAYIFWLHPEVFNMASVTACLYFGLSEPVPASGHFTPRRRWLGPLAEPLMEPLSQRLAALRSSPLVRALVSGAALVPAAYNKPMLALLGLPVLFVLVRGRRWRETAAWCAGGAVATALIVGLAMALMGHPSAYLGLARGGKEICSPHQMPVEPEGPPPGAASVPLAAPPAAEPAAGGPALVGAAAGAGKPAPAAAAIAPKKPPAASWYWMFRVPRFNPREVAENVGYFLWGRHTGLFLYFPFTLLTLLLFLLHARRSAARWVVLGTLAAVAAIFLLWIPNNWQGGGGFVGNRYYVNAYPAFLFLVTRVAPSWLNALGYALGGVLLGPTIFTPMGRAVPWPTLQAHVRNFPYPHFPLELSLREVPGYLERTIAGMSVQGRQDVFLPRGPSVWVHGATTVELWVQSGVPIERLQFYVESLAAPNDIVLRIGEQEVRLHFAADEAEQPRRVELSPERPTKLRSVWGTPAYAYRFEVSSATGEVRGWTRRFPPEDCTYFPFNASLEESFYVGAQILFLGPAAPLEKDVYAVEWGECRVPRQVSAGEVFTVATRVHNRSGESWPNTPPTQVGLGYRWETPDGKVVEVADLRTRFDHPIEPGELVAVQQEVRAPAAPGSYVLVLDLVFELVAWFSDKNGGNVYRAPVEVVAPAAAPSPAAAGGPSADMG